MSRRLITTGSPFEARAGYSRAVVDGEFCFVAGTTGYDYATMAMPEDVGAQTRNALATIRRALEEGGFAFEDIVRVTYIVTDPADVPAVYDVVGEAFRDIRPASTMLIAGLVTPEMKVEVEATAKKRP